MCIRDRVTPIKPSKPNRTFKKNILDSLSDDLNISKALAYIDEMISNSNDRLDINPKDKSLKREIVANIEFINKLLGIGEKEPFSYFQIGIDSDLKLKIEDLISKRDIAKKSRDYILADKIREEILALGISIMDTPNGTVWEKI